VDAAPDAVDTPHAPRAPAAEAPAEQDGAEERER
jgi:hypothetical protein